MQRLDGRPDQHGHEQYGVFVRKELAARAWTERSPQRESFHRDVDRILSWKRRSRSTSSSSPRARACSRSCASRIAIAGTRPSSSTRRPRGGARRGAAGASDVALVTFVDGSLLAPVGGVAARLRYRIGGGRAQAARSLRS